MLQDAIWANTEKLERPGLPGHRRSSSSRRRIKGWSYCRDNAEKCRDIVVAKRLEARREPPAVADERDQQAHLAVAATASASSTRRRGTRRSRSPSSTKNADGDTVLTKEPEGLAYTNDYVQKALDALKADGDVDVVGTDFKPITVKLNAGGA